MHPLLSSLLKSTKTAPGAMNVAEKERLASIAGGVALLGAAVIRRSGLAPVWLFLGGSLIKRGLSGQCQTYQKMGINTATLFKKHPGVADGHGVHLEKSIEINRAPSEVFAYWRNLSNLPTFMPHLKSVTETAPGISRWAVDGPVGTTVEWDAEIINEHPGEMISWQTLPGAYVSSAGTVRFEPTGNGQNTHVTVNLKYELPAKAFGTIVAKIFGDPPEKQLDEDLKRFKMLLEVVPGFED